GTLELFTGNKSIRPIYKAIAPVWEVNHIWLILAVVIVFNGFPNIYAELSTSLHIPLFIILLGIIMRGTAFTFRHYDAKQGKSQFYYNLFFRASSVLTSFFLGIVLGAMILGQMTNSVNVSFPERFIFSWLHPFCISVGFFTTTLFAYIASVYIIGETQDLKEQNYFAKITRLFCFATILLGGLVLFLGLLYKAPFMLSFFSHKISLVCFGLVTVLLPFIWLSLKNLNTTRIRILVALQVGLIMAGWAFIQLPTIIYLKSGNHLTVFNTAAGDATLYYLTIALIIGSILIFPSLYYLFRVFKKM
ncbi:MAG: cytochrome d ubiquinol oxidase subunit II, partial [Bacteroidota bacterium]